MAIRRLLASLLVALLFVIGWSKAQDPANRQDHRPLGIEINLANAFYLPAATGDKKLIGVIRVEKGELDSEKVSGLEILPIAESDGVRVEVSAIFGDIGKVERCSDLNTLPRRLLFSRVLNRGETLNLSQLIGLKRKANEAPLMLKIVGARRNYADDPFEKISATVQIPGCGSCGNTVCCPDPNRCIRCGDCGIVCVIGR